MIKTTFPVIDRDCFVALVNQHACAYVSSVLLQKSRATSRDFCSSSADCPFGSGRPAKLDAFSGVSDFVRKPCARKERCGKASPFGRSAVRIIEDRCDLKRREGRRALM